MLAAGVTLAALVAGAFPQSLELTRDALTGGQAWRLWSYTLVHSEPAHAWFDIGALATLLIGFPTSRRAFRLAICATPVIGVGTLVMHPELDSLCGLSGLLHGLCVLTAVEHVRATTGLRRAMFFGFALAVSAKAIVEAFTGTAWLTGTTTFEAPIAFAAHGIGSLTGWIAGAIPSRKVMRARTSDVPSSVPEIRERVGTT